MNTAAKLSAYGAALALLLAGSWATGSAVGPLTTVATADPAGHGEPGAGSAGHGDTHSGTVVEADPPGVVRTAGFTVPTGPVSTSTAPAHDADGH